MHDKKTVPLPLKKSAATKLQINIKETYNFLACFYKNICSILNSVYNLFNYIPFSFPR